MWLKTVNWIVGILLLVSLFLSGYMFYKLRHLSVPDVIQIHDTIIIKQDSIIEKLIERTYVDTVIDFLYIVLSDTIKVTDTIRLPIDHKVSLFSIEKDSLTINEQIWHSGYRSTIDSISLSYDLHYSVPLSKKKRFAWAVTIGPSISYNINLNTMSKTWDYGPAAGVSIVIGPSFIIK